MPLIVLCGHPCSGKTTTAIAIAEVCRQKGWEAMIINEDSLHRTRKNCYSDVPSEKNTRGLLKSSIDRGLAHPHTVVIFDSLNNIKGYRYELWCLARSAATRYAMVHIDTPVETCREWNELRHGDSFPSDIFEDLASRFERPDARNRWDAPLFSINPLLDSDHITENIEAIVRVVVEESQNDAVAAAAAVGASVVGSTGKELTPNLATTNASLSSTNMLHEIDRRAQAIVDKLVDIQTRAGSGAAGLVHLDEDAKPLFLDKSLSLPELRRLKRTFMRLVTKTYFSKLPNAKAADKLFIDYLREHIS